EYCEAVQLNCGVDAPQQIPKRLLPGHIRRNLFLVVKETLNNIVKHAQASTVTIRISCNEDLLQISISDNGRGFQPTETRSYNNGLRNMRRRMEAVNGTFSIEPAGNGTQVTLLIPMDVATWQPPAATPPSQQ
ncbi:MAG TPA: ATP-binding protein, partial [Lacibacter sp.]|nr:ATP-binding protein [Lacibacter sp.]